MSLFLKKGVNKEKSSKFHIRRKKHTKMYYGILFGTISLIKLRNGQQHVYEERS